MDALSSLAATPPRTYLQRSSDGGETELQSLFQHCMEAGLVPNSAAASDDIAKLHSLFDVALDHGLGSLVLDYVLDVCADRLLTSSDPLQAFLLDGECVRRWCQKTLTVCKGRLTSWLARGLGFIASSGTLPKELARLRALQLVVQALSSPDQQQQQQQQLAAGAGTGGTEADEDEVARLIQCGTVLAWLSQQRGLLGGGRAGGRFSSEQEWRSATGKRKDSAAPLTLFVADTLAALAAEGIAGLQYPPPGGVERLVGGLFLAGATCQRAWRLKLSLLAYWLVDGGFVQPRQLADEFSSTFAIPQPLASAWALCALLDDAHLPEHISSGATDGSNPALEDAAGLLPDVDGSALPFKALQVFLQHGSPATALSLLRQRDVGGVAAAAAAREGEGSGGGGGLQEASVAVAVLLGNGLLAEAYMQVKRHLGSLADSREGFPAQHAERHKEHAEQLMRQLLEWGLQAGSLHAIIRLPLGTIEEEVTCSWLAGQAGERPQCGLILVLLYLLRGRTPEALLAHVQHCAPGAGGEVQGQLEELLRQAGSTLPSVQRALSLRQADEPAVRIAAGTSGMGEEGEGAAQGSVPLTAGVPGLAADGQAPIVAEGPSPQDTPLVGSVPALLALQQWQRAQQEGAVAAAVGEPAGGAEAAAPAASAPAFTAPTAQQAARGLFQPPAPAPVEQPQQLRALQTPGGVAGFTPGGLLGGPASGAAPRAAQPARFGGAGAAAARGTPLAFPIGGARQQLPLPEGMVGDRDFDRMLGLQQAAPARSAGRARGLRGGARLAR